MKLVKITKAGKVEKSCPENGTHLQGFIEVAYDKLYKIFGAPNTESDKFKTDVRWVIKTPDGIATIYNWKNGRSYLGKEGPAVEDISNWNIGGHSMAVVAWIEEALQITEQTK